MLDSFGFCYRTLYNSTPVGFIFLSLIALKSRSQAIALLNPNISKICIQLNLLMPLSEKFQPCHRHPIQPRTGLCPASKSCCVFLSLVRYQISVGLPSADTNLPSSCFPVGWGLSTRDFKFWSKLKSISEAAEGCSCSSTFWELGIN